VADAEFLNQKSYFPKENVHGSINEVSFVAVKKKNIQQSLLFLCLEVGGTSLKYIYTKQLLHSLTSLASAPSLISRAGSGFNFPRLQLPSSSTSAKDTCSA